MPEKQALQQREKELQALLRAPAGQAQPRELGARYAAAGGRPRPGRTSLITYLLVHERERGLLGS
jgi:hypothetical protein